MQKLDKKFLQKFYAKAGSCVNDFEMINDGDSVLTGVSGGKDSLALLDVLAGRRKYSRVKFDLNAVFVDVAEIPYKTDLIWLKKFCESIDVPLEIVKVSVDFSKAEKEPACFYCSWQRRKKLFEIAESRNIDKIALGHHRDDALETLFLNMVSHGIISSMPGKLPMFENKLNLIRPLLYHNADETEKYAKIKGFPLNNQACPYDDKTRRIELRNMINEMDEKFQGAKKNMFKSILNIYPQYLPVKSSDSIIKKDDKISE